VRGRRTKGRQNNLSGRLLPALTHMVGPRPLTAVAIGIRRIRTLEHRAIRMVIISIRIARRFILRRSCLLDVTLLLGFFGSMIFAADRCQIDDRFGIGHMQIFHRVRDDLRYGKITEPFVV
jgi:hypothetical protein